MMFLSISLAWLLLATNVLGDLIVAPPKADCAQGCFLAFDTVTFSGKKNSPSAPCYNTIQAQSVYLCTSEYCSSSQIEAGLDLFQEICREDGVDVIPYSVISKITADQLKNLTVVGPKQITNKKLKYSEPILLNQAGFEVAYKTLAEQTFIQNRHAYYGWGSLAYWGLVICIGMINRAINFAREVTANGNDVAKSPNSAMLAGKSWIRRTLIFPALFAKHCRQPIGMCTVPPRLETISICLWIIMNLVFCCINYPVFEGNLNWSATSTQTQRYVAERTGCIATANFTLIWLFAQRNNVVMFLTGWSFSTFNAFHRWAARVVTLQCAVHTIAMCIYDVEGKRIPKRIPQQYWQMGLVAMLCMALMLSFSILWLRRRAYEVFLITHISLAVVFVAAVYLHLDKAQQYRPYVWTCVGLWAFDRFARLCRLVILQVNSRSMQATASYDAAANAIQLKVASSSLLKPQPGQYYFVYLVQGWKFWESHPFTISSWSSANISGSASQVEETQQSSAMQLKSNVDFEKKEIGIVGAESPTVISSSSSATSESLSGGKGECLSFIIRPYDSFTARLRDIALQSSKSAARLRVAVEGPYGSPLEAAFYGNLLYVIGGTGITVPMSYLTHLRQSGSANQNQKIHIIWAIREQALLDLILNDGFREQLEYFNGNLTMSVYITSRSGTDSSTPTSNSVNDIEQVITPAYSKEITPSASLHQHVTMYSSRPDVSSLVTNYVTSPSLASASSKKASRVCVITCGPPQMSDVIRSTVVKVLGSRDLKMSGVDLTFKDEGFSW